MEARVQHGKKFRRLASACRGIERLQRGRSGKVDLLIAFGLQKFGQRLGLLDRGRADEHGLHLLIGSIDLGDDGAQFLFGGAIDLVILVEAAHRSVGRNFDHVEIVDFGEFIGLGRGRAGHAGELFIKPEIVLEGDRREGHVLRLNLHALFGFERLMQTFRITVGRGIMRPVNSSMMTTSPLRTM